MTALDMDWMPSSPASLHERPLYQGTAARAASILAFVLMLCLALGANAQGAARARIDFVYFGSPECPYCRGWEASDLPKLRKARLFRHVRFTKITKAIASPVPAAELFPEEIRNLREPIAEKIQGAGSPMFAILADGHVVASWRGAKQYTPDQILKIIGLQWTQLSSGPTPKPAADSVAMR